MVSPTCHINFPYDGHCCGEETDTQFLTLVVAYEIVALKLLRAKDDAKLPSIRTSLDDTLSNGRDRSRVMGSAGQGYHSFAAETWYLHQKCQEDIIPAVLVEPACPKLFRPQAHTRSFLSTARV